MSSGGPASIEIERVAETGSTNADLLAWARRLAAAATAPRPRLLVAERQTAGRGRGGRTWHATPGASLTFSLAWPMGNLDLSGLSLAVGVAIADALDTEARAALRIGLKWPNDLWLVGKDEPGRKLGGVLIETTPVGSGRLAVIGVGLNVRPQAVPEASSGVAALREIDAQAECATVLDRIVPALASALDAFDRAGFAPFRARFEARDLLRGQTVRCGVGADADVHAHAHATDDADRAIEGTAEGVSPSGVLRVRKADGTLALIGSGEVSVRPAGSQRDAAGARC